MTLEKKNFRADARVLHEKASGGELGRKKKNVFFSSLFFDFPKRGLPWKALKLRLAGLALKNRFLSRLSKNETAVESIEIAPSWSSIKKSVLSPYFFLDR